MCVCVYVCATALYRLSASVSVQYSNFKYFKYRYLFLCCGSRPQLSLYLSYVYNLTLDIN
jgi:hypothetical protein